MERYHPYGYHKRQPAYVPRPYDPVDTARYEAEERAWYEESFSWYRPFPSIRGWYANGCLPQRGPGGWIMTSPKWQAQSNPTSPIYANQPEEERGPVIYSPTAARLDLPFAKPHRHDRMSPLALGPSRRPDAPPPQGSVLPETIAKGRSILLEKEAAEAGAGAHVCFDEGGGSDSGGEEEEEEDEEVVFSHAPDPHANSGDEDEVPLSHFVVDGKLKGPAPVGPPPDVEPGVYMDDDEAENGKFAWKWTPAEPAAKEEREEAESEKGEEKGGGGGGDSDFYDD